MNFKKLTKLEEFQSLKAGDRIVVEWFEWFKGLKQIMYFEIPMVQHFENEIICNTKSNIYFNYKMHLGLDRIGVNTSNAKEVFLIEV